MQIAEQVDLADQACSESISDIPIKKRLRLSWCSASTSEETGTLQHKCNGQPKKSSWDSESSALEYGAAVVVETNIEPDNLNNSPFALCNQRSQPEGEHETSFLHGNPTEVNQFKKGSALNESNMMENVNPASRLSLGPEVVKQKQFIGQPECEVFVDSRTVGVQFSSCDVAASKRAETSNLRQSSCEDEQYHGLDLSKQVKVETCCLDVHLPKVMQNHQIKNKHLNSENTFVNSSAHLCINREKWDLNVPMEVWESKHDMNIALKMKNMHQQKMDKNLIQAIGATTGNKSTSGSSVFEVSKCHIRAKNSRQPADGSRVHGDGLDLQLRPPSRPDLCSSLGIASVDLSLSLNGGVLGAPNVKPEPLENGSPNRTGTSELNSVKPVAKTRVKLEQCDGNSHGKASKIPAQSSLPGKMVKPEPQEELHGKELHMPLDSKQLTTYHAEVPQNLNSNSLPTERSAESSYPPLDLDPSGVSGPKMPAEVEDAINDDFVCRGAEERGSKSDFLAGSNLSDVEGCDEKGEINKIVGMAPSMHNKSVVSDLENQKTSDGLSEGSADMDCSDGEYYNSPENLHANLGNSSEPSSGSKEGIDIKKIHRQRVDVNKENLPISLNQTCIRTKVTSPGVGEVKVEDGDPGGHVLTAAEASCDHEEKGVLQCANEDSRVKSKVISIGAVSTVGSECCEPVMNIHVDVDAKRKEKNSAEAKDGHNTKKIDGILCHDKRETSYELTAVLSDSHRSRLVKSYQGAIDNNLEKKKGLEIQESPKEAYAEIAKTNKGYVGRSPMNSSYAFVSNKHPVRLDKDLDVCGTVNSHFHDIRKHADFKYADNKHSFRHTEKSSPSPMRFYSNKMPISARTISPGPLNDRWIDKQKRDLLCTQRRRSSKFDSTNRDQPIGGFESDHMNSRRNGNRHFIWDPNIQYEELNNSRQYQLQRSYEDTEVPFSLPPNRISRRTLRTVDDPRHHSHIPSWRHMQGPPFPESIRETVPDRFIGREVHEGILDLEEKVMNLPDERVDDLLYSRSNMQYDPADRDLLPRGRSSSPIQRPRLKMYRSSSPCQWSSPGRRPEMAIDNHNHSESPIRHGPPVMRVDMVRSRPHLCFPEDMMVRRNDSPPYAHFPDDVREMHPLNEFVLPRSSRNMQRNVRSSDLEPYENAEYIIGPSRFTDQFADRRDYHDRRGLAQRLWPHGIPGHGEEDNPPYPHDDSYLRPIKCCPDSEVIPARGSARNCDNHVKNRLGPAPNRLRGKGEVGEDYRYHGRQGWRDGDHNDGRLKRRKF